MSEEIKVKVKALAYEKAKLPTKISDLVNDEGYVKVEDLMLVLEDFKAWITENFRPAANPPSDINGGTASSTDWGRYLFGGTATTTEWGATYHGGNAKK